MPGLMGIYSICALWRDQQILGQGGRGRKQSARPHAPKSPGTPLEGTTDPPTDKTLLFRG